MLRPYQIGSLEDLRAKMRQGVKRLVLVAPTGAGKTTVAAEMARGAVARGRRVLFLAHRRELIEQASDRMVREGLAVGAIMAGIPATPAPVQVASVQTLVRGTFPGADLVIVDECHHAKAKTYEKILAAYPNAFVVGLTATPWRLDGKGLKDLFIDVVVAATPRQLIDLGFLCDYQGYAYLAPDTQTFHTRGGDFDEGELSTAYDNSKLRGDIVGKWLEHARGMRTILFASSIPNSIAFVERFKAEGVAAEHLDHETPLAVRRATFARVRSGETTLLLNVGLVTEGVDIPELQCCILARPTQSLALYLQMVGRVMRPKGGDKARIHDHAENAQRHGLPDDERDYSLEATTKKDKPKSLRTCPQCLAIYEPSLKACPVCGFANPKEVLEADVSTGAARELSLKEIRNEQTADFTRWLLNARTHRMKPGWAVVQFVKRYGESAPKPWGIWRKYVDKQTKWWRNA